jgi:SPP1 family predicted phage head-tail adaptor
MRAGLLRHRLEVQSRAGSQDTYGQTLPEWTTTATVWGQVEPLLGRERFTAQQVQAEVTHKITLRARDVSPSNRIKFGERHFGIIEVLNPSERSISLTLMAKEEVA